MATKDTSYKPMPEPGRKTGHDIEHKGPTPGKSVPRDTRIDPIYKNPDPPPPPPRKK